MEEINESYLKHTQSLYHTTIVSMHHVCTLQILACISDQKLVRIELSILAQSGTGGGAENWRFDFRLSPFRVQTPQMAHLPALNAVIHSFGHDGTSVRPGRCIKHSSIASASSYNRLQCVCATLSGCIASPIPFDSGAVVGNL